MLGCVVLLLKRHCLTFWTGLLNSFSGPYSCLLPTQQTSKSSLRKWCSQNSNSCYATVRLSVLSNNVCKWLCSCSICLCARLPVFVRCAFYALKEAEKLHTIKEQQLSVRAAQVKKCLTTFCLMIFSNLSRPWLLLPQTSYQSIVNLVLPSLVSLWRKTYNIINRFENDTSSLAGLFTFTSRYSLPHVFS